MNESDGFNDVNNYGNYNHFSGSDNFIRHEEVTGAAEYVAAEARREQTPPAAPDNRSPESGFAHQKSSVKIHPAALVAICLVCAVLGASLCLGGYKLIRGDDTRAIIVSGKETGSGTAMSVTGQTSDQSAGKTAEQTSQTSSQVTIKVDGVTSPATAVAAKVLPSVVGIQVKVTSTSWYGTSVSGGQGSGVILSEDGYIITNYHVISSAVTSTGEPNPNADLTVYLYADPETPVPASVIGYDQSSDLAVLKIEKSGLTAIEIGDSDSISVGDTAIAIGNPGGLNFMGSVSQGIISGLNRSIQIDSSYKSIKLIQTDAAINPGNSGGALTDIEGKLIGINSAKIALENYEGMGFAIPVKDVVSICTDIIKNGSTSSPYLGLEISSDYSASYLERLGYPGGLLVSSVIADSPAARAGIEEEDIIVSFNGTETKSTEDLVAAKNKCSPGDTVKVRIYRLTSSRFGRWTGSYYDVEVTLG